MPLSLTITAADLPTYDRLRSLLAAEFDIDMAKVTLSARLQEDLGIDSLDRVELLMNVEDAFGLSFTDDEVSKVTTVGDVVELVDGKLSARRQRAAHQADDAVSGAASTEANDAEGGPDNRRGVQSTLDKC